MRPQTGSGPSWPHKSRLHSRLYLSRIDRNASAMKAIVCCLLFLAASPIAHAGGVYKCNVAGRSVYQDMPCKNGKTTQLQQSTTSSNTKITSMSLATLYSRIRAAAAAERQIRSDMDRDIARTKARLGTKVADPSSNSEAQRIRNEWQPRLQEASRVSDSLLSELRRRCPGGAALNGSAQSCNK